MIRIAIQKSGRLSEGSIELIEECGISINRSRKDKLKTKASNFDLELLFLRDDDIPQYVEDGIVDIGIIGENIVIEKDKDIEIVEHLGFAKCRLSLAVPKDQQYNGIDFFNNKEIATSYPVTLRKFLQENNIDAGIHEISGSVEIAPGIGLADAICDLVSSGSTLFSNGLKEVEVILKSDAVIISNKSLNEEKQELIDKLLFRIISINKAKHSKYILLNTPNDSIEKIRELLPGMKSPTVMPLLKKGWSSLHTVVNEGDIWHVIDKLKKFGAEGILVMPIEKML